MAPEPDTREELQKERFELLHHLDRLTDKPMTALAFVWLALLIVDFTSTNGLSPGLQRLTQFIWALFVLDFLLSFTVAPNKLRYLRTNWLTVLSLLLPAARVLRAFSAFKVLRLLRAGRGLNLLRLVTTVNRSFRALSATLRRRGLPFVVALTAILTFSGAAGMLALEGEGFRNYWDALWWTAMLMTTLGSEFWPKTPEGRLLTWLLSVYAFAVFGYITAAIASYFVGLDQDERQDSAGEAAPAGPAPDLALLSEVVALRRELAAFRDDMSRRER